MSFACGEKSRVKLKWINFTRNEYDLNWFLFWSMIRFWKNFSVEICIFPSKKRWNEQHHEWEKHYLVKLSFLVFQSFLIDRWIFRSRIRWWISNQRSQYRWRWFVTSLSRWYWFSLCKWESRQKWRRMRLVMKELFIFEKEFIDLQKIRKCTTQKGDIFVLEEFGKTRGNESCFHHVHLKIEQLKKRLFENTNLRW